LFNYYELSDEGVRALALLTALTSLDLAKCNEVTEVRGVEGDGPAHRAHQPQLGMGRAKQRGGD
jgi:hypothetical protein